MEGIDDASGRSLANLDGEGGLASSVVFAKAGYLVQLVVFGPTDDANELLAEQLALDQFNRL